MRTRSSYRASHAPSPSAVFTGEWKASGRPTEANWWAVAEMAFALGESDAAPVQVDVPARGRVAVTDPTTGAGLPTSRIDVRLFRVR